jgi:hypothetical protein
MVANKVQIIIFFILQIKPTIAFLRFFSNKNKKEKKTHLTI